MKCPKCKGRMYADKFYDFVRSFEGWKCCQCGLELDHKKMKHPNELIKDRVAALLSENEELKRERDKLINKLNTDSQNFEIECLKARADAAESREKDLAAKLEIVSVAASALAFCAETSGGTAGRDEDLCRAIEGVKSILSLPIPGSAQRRDEEVRREAFRELSKLGELESKNGTFRIILDYDNYQDGARILDGDENVLAECYDIDQTPEDQFATAIESAIRAACEKGGEG